MDRQVSCQFKNPARLYQIALCATGAVVVLFAACRLGSEAPSSSPPGSALQYGVSYFRDSSSLGSQPADGNALRIEDSLSIDVTLIAVNPWRENVLEPVASQARMITALPAGTPVAAVPRLMRCARVGVVRNETQFREQMAAGQSLVPVPVEKLHGVLPHGIIASFRIAARPASDSGAIRALEIQVHRGLRPEPERQDPPATGVVLGISLVTTGSLKTEALPDEDDVAASGKEREPSTPAGAAMLTTETIVLTPQALQDQDRLAVVLPSPFDVEGIAAFAALIEVRPPAREGTAEAVTHAVLLKQCQDDVLAAAGESGREAGRQLDAGRRGIEDAVRLLQSPTRKQRALLHLARETGAPLIEDMTLSATDVVVDHLAHAITNECASGLPTQTDVLGWRLEKAAFQLLVKLLSADQTSPGLEAIAIRHTGEVGRHPSVLQEMVSEATSVEDLRQRLLLENFIYLEDISPAARTRAFEWLAVRSRAPEGYDPLASLKERRSVLNRVLQEP